MTSISQSGASYCDKQASSSSAGRVADEEDIYAAAMRASEKHPFCAGLTLSVANANISFEPRLLNLEAVGRDKLMRLSCLALGFEGSEPIAERSQQRFKPKLQRGRAVSGRCQAFILRVRSGAVCGTLWYRAESRGIAAGWSIGDDEDIESAARSITSCCWSPLLRHAAAGLAERLTIAVAGSCVCCRLPSALPSQYGEVRGRLSSYIL